MTLLSVSQLVTLRKRPQTTKLYLSIYQPKTIFQAQVTGSYAQGDNQISIYGITTGSWWSIYPNMTARIGSTPGGNEFGDLRVRSASGTYVQFAENEIIWQQGMYLTMIDAVDVQAIYPRIIQDPNNQTNVIFYKDYDIPYSNQNTIYGTFPCAGPHRAGFIVTGAWSTYYSSSGTYNVNGDSLTFSWAFEGGTPTGSTTRDPGYVRYTTPGHYKTRLIVTSSAGAVDTTYRYASAYQKPDQGTFNPIEAWNLEDLSGSRGEGGHTTRIKIMSIMPELQPHALVVIFAEDTYGGNIVSLGGNSENNSSIVFVGYVLQDSIRFDYKQSTMEFDIGSVSEIMKEAEGFSISCESKATATTWYELKEMTVQKALYHYLRWHSTVLNLNDFQYTADDRYLQFFDSDRESLFDAIDNFMRSGLIGSVVTDRQGKLWAEISHFGMQTPFSTVPRSMTLNKQDWMGEPNIQERRDSDVSFVELGGIAYYGTATNTFSALISNAPGTTPLYHGKTERQPGLVLLSQSQLNQVAANYLANKNTPFPEVSLPLNGNYRNLDIAPQEQLFLVVSRSDTIRDISLEGKPYQISSMSWRYDSVKEMFTPDVVLEQMATGTMSETVLIPAVPPYVGSGFDYPSLQLPTLPIFNPPSVVGPTVPTQVLMHDTSVGILYSEDFDSASPNWRTINFGLTAAQYQSINEMFVTPSGALYVAFARNQPGTGNFIARAPFVGGTFSIVYDGVNGIRGIGYNPLVSDYICTVINVASSSDQYLFAGSGGTLVQGAVPNIGFGNERADITFGDGKWMGCRYGAFQLFSEDGLSVASSGTLSPITPEHKRAGTTGKTFHERSPTSGIVLGEGNLTTNTLITDADMNPATFITNMAVEPTGALLMSVYGAGSKGKSSDGGFTFGLLPNLPPGGAYAFAYGGSGGEVFKTRWIAARGIVRFSPDFGNTWVNKEGNITTVVPFPLINMVRVVGQIDP